MTRLTLSIAIDETILSLAKLFKPLANLPKDY